jgi:hypothetical protein
LLLNISDSKDAIMPDSIEGKQKESNSQPYLPLRNRTNSVKTIETVIYNPPGSAQADIPEGLETPSPAFESTPASKPAEMSQIIGNTQQKAVRFHVSLSKSRFHSASKLTSLPETSSGNLDS